MTIERKFDKWWADYAEANLGANERDDAVLRSRMRKAYCAGYTQGHDDGYDDGMDAAV